MYKVSIFSHVYTKDNVACIFNSLSIRMLYVPIELVEIYRHPESVEILEGEYEAFVSSLIDSEMWVPLESDEFSLAAGVFSVMDKGVDIHEMVLHMTDYCNLRCSYCFIEDGIGQDYVRRNMSWDTAKHAVDKFIRISSASTLEDRRTIVFYGGEPLLNFDVIEKVLAYLKTDYPELKIKTVIITNGLLLDPYIADVFHEYGVDVCVSLDGPKDVNDACRMTADGCGSFDRVVENIRMLQSHGIDPGLSSVMTRESVASLGRVADFLFGELGIKGVGFNHVSIIPSSGDYSGYDEEYENSYGDSLIRMADIIEAEYPDVYEKRMDYKRNCFLLRTLSKSSCTGTGHQISVSTDGQIGICQGYMGSRNTFNNSVFDEDYDPRQDEVFIEWSKRSPYNMPECLSCPALATCGGGCPRNAESLTGSIWGVDKGFCIFSLKAQEWLIWKYYEKVALRGRWGNGYFDSGNT